MEIVNPDSTSTAPRTELESEVMEFFVRAAQLLGQPRSIGEIYGLLYLSMDPLSMEQIVQRLEISTGSVSQGLKQLRAFRAVRTTYVPGQRRDFFVAEQELRKVISGFVQEEIKPHLDSGRERLDRMADALADLPPGAEKEHLEKRVQKLEKLHSLSAKLLPMALRFLKL
jgi:HTH-type transcriptional regulator, glycine betaine synthesis regulator